MGPWFSLTLLPYQPVLIPGGGGGSESQGDTVFPTCPSEVRALEAVSLTGCRRPGRPRQPIPVDREGLWVLGWAPGPTGQQSGHGGARLFYPED